MEARSSSKMPTLKPHGTADNELPDNSNAKPQRSEVSFAGEKPQIRKVSEPLQLDREDLRLVDQVQLKLQRSDLVRDGAVVRLCLGDVVVRIPVLDGPVAAAEVPVAQSLLGLPRGEPVQALLAPRTSCASRMRASSMVMPRSGRTVFMLNRCKA